jgi:nickel-dependent lactate racemase
MSEIDTFQMPFSCQAQPALQFMPRPTSNIESPLVKSLHPIGEIAARIAGAGGTSVHLARQMTAANGSPATENDENAALSLDPTEATISALAEPIDFPPLAAGIVPGDRIAIAIDEAIPCAGEIVRGAIRALQSAGVECEAISVVCCDATTHRVCRDACSTEESNGVKFVIHDPDDEANLCMVGVSKRGEPMLVNRIIFDADVVLPIGCAWLKGRGVYESLFPRFSNGEAIRRYRTPARLESAADEALRIRETNEAGWLIGVPMVVEVVPGSGESVAHVLAGDPNAVARKCQMLSQEHWSLECPQQVSLMIATITGGPESQNWTSVGRALATAENLVAEGGAIAICSNLSEPPGHSLGRLIGTGDLETAQRKISHDHDADSWPAWQLARALQRGPMYFLSQLNDETVEDLGLAPVESIDELVRLAAHHESVAVVEDAQNAVVTFTGERDEL